MGFLLFFADILKPFILKMLYRIVEEFAYTAYHYIRSHNFNAYRMPFEARNTA